MVSMLGFSFSGKGQNAALAFVPLKDWDERERRQLRRRRSPAGRSWRSSGSRRLHLRAVPAADPRARHRDRLHLPPAGPRRQRPRRAGRGAQPAARHGRAEHVLPACAPTAWRTRRSCSSTSTATRPTRSACPSRRSTPRSRPRSARPTSTTSRTRAACSASSSRPTRRSRMQPDDLLRLNVRNASGGMVPLSALRHARVDQRARCRSCATTATRRCGISGDAAPGLQHRRGDGRDGAPGGPAARRLRLRVDRPVARGDSSGSQAPLLFGFVAPGRVPVPGRAVRELVDPAVGDAGGAARRARRGAGRDAARTCRTTSTSRSA